MRNEYGSVNLSQLSCNGFIFLKQVLTNLDNIWRFNMWQKVGLNVLWIIILIILLPASVHSVEESGQTADDLFTIGKSFYSKKNWNQALESFDKVIQINSTPTYFLTSC